VRSLPATQASGEQTPGAAEGRPLEVLEGEASYYSDKLAGRPTASGERYDPKALTAAHLSLPFGSVVRVTCVRTGKLVVVRVNDRGPRAKTGRILDLSRSAAEQLDMIAAGVIPVRAEVLEYGPHR
jgi:rare lipoprotein A